MARDYYDILGLSKSASESEIKSSYRKLAMKYHPDRNPGDKKAEEKFKEISESYEILKDPQKKAAYDQFGHAAFSTIHATRSGKPMPQCAACSGARDVGVMPGWVLISSNHTPPVSGSYRKSDRVRPRHPRT